MSKEMVFTLNERLNDKKLTDHEVTEEFGRYYLKEKVSGKVVRSSTCKYDIMSEIDYLNQRRSISE